MDGQKSVADEILKLKGLMDSGAITEEEFNRQKEKLLSPPEENDNEVTNKESVERKIQIVKEKFLTLKPVYKVAIGIAVILILFLGYVTVSGPVLTGDDKYAYEIIMKHVDSFKNPSSIRISSGTLLSPKDDPSGEGSLFCGISGINGFGSRTTSYYWMSGDGDGLLESDSEFCYEADGLNFDRINKKLEKKLKGKY